VQLNKGGGAARARGSSEYSEHQSSSRSERIGSTFTLY